MNQPAVLKPLKTWSHLAARRRKPSEYEIVSTNLHFTTDNPDAPFELDPNFPLAIWFKTYRNASPLKHAGLERLPRSGRDRLPHVQHAAGRPGELCLRPVRPVFRTRA